MSNYKNGKIYMLGLPPFLPYYGSTIQSLEDRLKGHRVEARQYLNGKKGKKGAYHLVLNEQCKIQLVEEYPCLSKKELERREGWYQLNNPCINHRIAGRTRTEWRDVNKEDIKNKRRQQYLGNKDITSKQNRQYQQSNSERIKEQRKEYRIKNIEKIKEQRKIKIVCDVCCSMINKNNMAAHKKSIRCLAHKTELISIHTT